MFINDNLQLLIPYSISLTDDKEQNPVSIAINITVKLQLKVAVQSS